MADELSKYGDVCESAAKAVEAEACVLIVVAGNRGNGISISSKSTALTLCLPDILEAVALDIRAQLEIAEHSNGEQR